MPIRKLRRVARKVGRAAKREIKRPWTRGEKIGGILGAGSGYAAYRGIKKRKARKTKRR